MQSDSYCFFPSLRGLLPIIIQPLLFITPLKNLLYNKDSSSESGGNGYLDPRFKRVLWYLIGSTKGGVNRAKILELINIRPANANRIATDLKLDYKTVLHHVKVLSENGLIITDNKDSY